MTTMYVLIDDVPGNATSSEFADHFKVESYSWGCSREISMVVGDTANREARNPVIGEVTLTKPADNSIVELARDAVGGTKGAQGKNVSIKFCQTGPDGDTVYFEQKLEEAMVSSYSLTAHEGGVLMETFTLSFTYFENAYTDYKSDNSAGSVNRMNYNLNSSKSA